MTREATTGSAMNYFISWQWPASTSWDLTCSHVPVLTGSTPSTVHSWCCQKRATTSFVCPGTRVTPAMRSASKTAWCSPRTTVTMISGPTTAQCYTAADSGTAAAPTVKWTVTADTVRSSGSASYCRHPACGWPVVRSAILLQSQRLGY